MEEDINEQLQILEETKEQIKQAIIDKGQSVSENDSFRSYVDKIDNIEVLEGQTKSVSPSTSQQVVTPDSSYNAITEITVEAVDNTIDNNISSENIKKDVTILGVTGTYEGTDTSDATANTEDIISGKTAYVNGQKLTGNLITISAGGSRSVSYTSYSQSTDDFYLYGKYQDYQKIYLSRDTEGEIGVEVPKSTLANAIDLTADKLKKDEVVLGLTGTYEGDTSSYFQDYTNGYAQSLIVTFPFDIDLRNKSLISFGNFTFLDNARIIADDTTGVLFASNCFYNCGRMTEMGTNCMLNLSNCAEAYSMFHGCNWLSNFKIKGLFAPTNYNGAEDMFSYCSCLVNFRNDFQISFENQTNDMSINHIFDQCIRLEYSPIINYHKVGKMYRAYCGCSNLKELDLTTINLSLLRIYNDYDDAFTGIPNDCAITVASQEVKDWVLSVNGNLTNITIIS